MPSFWDSLNIGLLGSEDRGTDAESNVPAWNDVESQYRQRYPDLNPDTMRAQYEQARQTRLARDRHRTWEPPAVHTALQMMPFAGTFHNARIAIAIASSHANIEAGRGTPEDYDAVAQGERMAQLEGDRTPAAIIGQIGLHVASMVGEAGLGGQALGAGAGVTRVPVPSGASSAFRAGAQVRNAFATGIGAPLRFAGIGGELGGISSRSGYAAGSLPIIGAEAGQALGRTALQTAVMPSMYVEDAINRNTQAGRDPMDWRGLPPAFTVGMMQTAILGSLGQQTRGLVPGRGVGPFLTRAGMAGPIGMMEQEAAHAIGWSTGLETGYGPLGSLVQYHRGKDENGWRNAASAWMAFTAFGALHQPEGRREAYQRQNLAEMGRLSRQMAIEGIPADAAAMALEREAKARTENAYGQVQQRSQEQPQPQSPTAPAPTGQEMITEPNQVRPPAQLESTNSVQPPGNPTIAPGERAPEIGQVVPQAAQGTAAAMPRAELSSLREEVKVRRLKIGVLGANALRQKVAADRQLTEGLTPEQVGELRKQGYADPQISQIAKAAREPATASPSKAAPNAPAAQPRLTPQSILERMRARQQPASPFQRPQPRDLVTPPSETARDLFMRHTYGEQVTPDQIDAAGKLTKQQSSDFWDYIGGRVLEVIGAERGVKRQAVHSNKDAAMEKLGLTEADVNTYTEQERNRRIEAGHFVRMTDQVPEDLEAHAKAIGQQADRRIELENELSGLVNQLKEAQKRGQPHANADAIYRRLAELGDQVSGRKPLENPEATRLAAESLESARTDQPAQAEPQEVAPGGTAEDRWTGSEQSVSEGANAADTEHGTVNPAEPMPSAEYRQQGGTHGEGPLIRTGNEKLASLGKENIKQTREAELAAQIEKQVAQPDKPLWEAARARMQADPGAAEHLANEVISSNGQRALNTTESLMLLHRRVSVRNELDTALRQAYGGEQLGMSESAYARLAQRVTDLTTERDLVDRAADLSGSETGRGLRIRQLFVKYDYSLEGILHQIKITGGGKDVDPKIIPKIIEEVKVHDEAQDRLAAAEKAFETEGRGIEGATYKPMNDAQLAALLAQKPLRDRINSARWEAMTPWQRRLSLFKEFHVFELISGVTPVGKIGSSSLFQVALRPVDEVSGQLWRLLFPKLAKQASVEGAPFDIGVEARAIGSAFTKGMKAGKDTLVRGESDLDVMLGMPRNLPRTWMNYLMSFHAAEKAPAVDAAFESTLPKIFASEKAAGRDVTSVSAVRAARMRAYQEGIKAKFQQDNAVVTAFERSIKYLKDHKESTAANALGHALDLLIPIRRTPTNIVAAAGERIAGVPIGLGRLGLAKALGSKLTDAQANGIMRQLKRGTLGMPLLALGYYLAKNNVGGFYAGRRDDRDVQAGEIRIGDVTIPAWVTAHHPAFMAMHLGATVARAETGSRRGDIGVLAGTGKGLGALFEQIPFMRAETLGGLTTGIGERSVGDLAKSFAIPQLIQQAATLTDRDERGLIHRRQDNIVEQLEAGVPGLRQRLLNDTDLKAVRDRLGAVTTQRMNWNSNPENFGKRFEGEREHYILSQHARAIAQLEHQIQGRVQAGRGPLRATGRQVDEHFLARARALQVQLARQALALTASR